MDDEEIGLKSIQENAQCTSIDSMMIESSKKESRDWEIFATYIRSFKPERNGVGVRSSMRENKF